VSNIIKKYRELKFYNLTDVERVSPSKNIEEETEMLLLPTDIY
jgi:hypothetical protein